MQGLRFNHVYAVLLFVCAMSAVVLPRFVDPARAQVQNIFVPVSRPAAGIAQWIHTRINRERVPDAASPDQPRSDDDIRRENAALRQQLAGLSGQLQKLQLRDAEHAEFGPLEKLGRFYTVTAGDAGAMESLLIGGSNLDGLHAGMAALYPGGLAGQLLTPGLTGTRVRLITDKGFSVTGVFARYSRKADGGTEVVRIATDPPLVRGDGNNGLLIDGMSTARAAEIRVNDVVLLDDDKWQPAVQGQPIGRVTAPPTTSRRAPGFAEIHLQPFTDLTHLRELMVVTRGR